MMAHGCKSILLLAFLMSSVSGRIWESGGTGFDGLPGVVSSTDRDRIIHANQHPNVTRSVSFRPFQGFSQSPNLEKMEWIWRVNVSDFAVPDAERYPGDYSLIDPYVVSVVNDFSFPDNADISSAIGGNTTTPYCITVILGPIGFPANVTNAYNDNHTQSPDCNDVLGSSCVQAMISNNIIHDEQCSRFLNLWSSLPECASTFGYAYDVYHSFGQTVYNINYANSTNKPPQVKNDSFHSLRSGEGAFGILTEASNGTNKTNYMRAANNLQVLLLNPAAPILDDASGRSSSAAPPPQVICMRVNTTHLDTGSSGENGALSLKYQSGASWAALWSLTLSLAAVAMLM